MKYLCVILFLYLFSGHVENSDHLNGSKIERNDRVEYTDPCTNSPKRQKTYTWYTDFDSKGRMVLIRGGMLDSIKTIDSAIAYLNKSSFVKIKKLKEKKNVLYVKIINDEYFTQQIGSTGASEFILSTLYTLTDHFGYDFVNFQFEEGDHGGQPGTKDRTHHHMQDPEIICK
jgi:hypothetical protein